jgi:hypothetical protein
MAISSTLIPVQVLSQKLLSVKKMAATSMAAALAASLPAPSSVAVAPAPTYEAIPASMAKVIDIEADIPLTSVQLDGLVCFFLSDVHEENLTLWTQVVTKIIKHAREAPSATAHGLLLGLDLDGILEVSNSFPLPHHAGDEDEKSSKSTGVYEFIDLWPTLGLPRLFWNHSTTPGFHASISEGSPSG